MVTVRDVAALIAERPELEPCIREVLAAEEPFSFDDLSLDSGQFGELVAAGVVTEVDAGYRVVDDTVVRQALDGDAAGGTDATARRRVTVDISLDRRVAVALAGVLAVLVAFRVVSFPSVFRDGAVVLSGNDPYYYRYWVEQLLTASGVSPGSLPAEVARGEPLTVVTLWLVTELVGGTRAAAGHVLAWYPVVSALVTGVLTYVLTVRVTDDRRVGLAAVLLLAVVPGHAFRTSLGVADHHAFDYPWLVLTALALVTLVERRELSRRAAVPALGLAVGVTGTTLAWEAGPLLLAPIGLSAVGVTLLAVHDGRQPFREMAGVLAGLGVAAALVWVAHTALGWHTALVAAAPTVLFGGTVAVVAVGDAVRRAGRSWRVLLASYLVAGVGGSLTVAVGAPAYWNQIVAAVGDDLLRGGNIAGTQTLFGDSFGWLLLFGFVLVLALPYVVWATSRARADTRWLPLVAYSWVLLVLAATQVRFVGEFAAFAALFAGLGFVHLAERVDIARSPAPFLGERVRSIERPSAQQLGALVVLFLLIGGLGMVQVPVKVSQVTIPNGQHETATWMGDYAEEHGLDYPDNYVFSQWGANRHYNYFVSGESRSYAYAQSNYGDFVGAGNATAWYEQLHGRAGFVVTAPTTPTGTGTVGGQLHRAYGSRTDQLPATEHYRAVYETADGRYKVFRLVPGAVLTGTGPPGTTVTLGTTVDVGDSTVEYTQQARTTSDGTFTARVPYPGQYTVGNRTVRIPQSAVANGRTVSVAQS